MVMETDDFCRMCFVDSNDRFSFAIAIFLVVHRPQDSRHRGKPAQQLSKHIERCDWVNTNGVRPIHFPKKWKRCFRSPTTSYGLLIWLVEISLW